LSDEVLSMGTIADAAQAPSGLNRVLFGRNPKRTLVRIVILVAVACVVRVFVLLPVEVEGPSMLPTYRDRSVHVINRLAYLFHEPQRGDVVAIGLEAGNHVMYLKRIVGLPGETVAFHQGQLYINGKPIEEPYLRLRGNWEHEAVPVPLDRIYVVGDNRDMEWEGHEKGRARRGLIVGKVIL
jgi:signal peptidase I